MSTSKEIQMPTKQFSNYSDLLTFTRASKGHALRPVSYGDELVTNGDFSTDSDWTKGTNWEITAGQAKNTGTVSSNIYQSNVTETGKVYEVSVNVVQNDGTCSLRTNNASTVIGSAISSTGTFTFVFVATGTQIAFRSGFNTNPVIIDDLSVKEVTFDQPDGTLTLFEHPDNVPRVEYDADGNRLGLLVEESRTNEIPYSEDFDNNDWTKQTGVTVTANQVISPARITNADEVSSSGSVFLYDVLSLTASTVYTTSVYIKNKDSEQTVIWGVDETTRSVFWNGSEISSVSSGVTYEEVGNGWYRIIITETSASDGQFITRIYPSYQSSEVKSVYLWGYQVEAGSFPTSYIKSNSGSTTTRSADVASIPVSDFGFNADNGSFVTQFSVIGDSSSAAYATALTDGTTSNMILQFRQAGTDLRTAILSGGTDQTVGMTTGSTNVDTLLSFGSAFATNDIAQSLNGVAVQTDSSASIPSGISSLRIGNRDDNTRPLNGHIKSIKYYPRRLSDAQLQDLTS